ncbi:RidA family protein [Aquimarina sp. D1M17]|uniref:RidA family protein n=1 Tax=Aquimarina acroporae TaxID=2937283 RepID=UPI0020BFFCAD|nr:RidA family protein [Aquimarina acroporae]MCK8520271.1 RidA family protein [Aquimarina acroporae]
MKDIKKVSSGAPWEEIVGYSRAIKIGDIIEVSGTTAPGADEYEQTINIIKIAEKALQELGADLSNVVRTRMYCTDISKWEKIGKAHGEFFSEIRPVATMVEVSKLINPEILVEIEFSAVV